MSISEIGNILISSVLCSSLVMGTCDPSNTFSSLVTSKIESHYSTSIWDDMGNRFALTDEQSNAKVQAHIARLQANPEDLYKILEQSSPYLSYVFEETKKHNLPAELALLPIVESELNPNARSKAGASGLWQLMPGTARALGLKSNATYDARKDVVASTQGALTHLKDLNQVFETDWLLTMAAYNSGSGRVQTAIKHGNNEANFWNLSRLPKETREYVPKVLALAAVIRNPEKYGIKLPQLNNRPQLASVKVNSTSELADIAEESGISMDALRKLNPGHRKMTVEKGKSNTFLVPVV